MMRPANWFRYIQKNFLPKEECDRLIEYAEKLGFAESLIKLRGKGEVRDTDVRDNDRVLFTDKELADKLWEKIKPLAPAQLENFEAYGLNDHFRFYRYKEGQQFKPHVDGSVKISPTELSLVTVLIYLNEDFKGGETTFVMENESIKPETGMLCMFTHKQLHTGKPVPEGVKYVLRTDIMYKQYASNAKVRDFTIQKVDYKTCLSFCQIWHYSKSCPAGKAYFGLFYGENIIGVICYGEPAMRNQKGCYNADIELRRLCCIDLTPKNTESYFIGNTLKAIKKMGFKRCISLADPNFGHEGTIYKASNFKYLGREQGGGSRDIFIDGEKMHSRTAFAKFGTSGYAGLKALFPEKDIKVMDKERKHVYVYDFYNCP